jgi:hypothetical protein
MSELTVVVGHGKRGVMTFDEPTPPTDGAVASDNAAIATISLDPDLVTWTVQGVALGDANMTYTGTSVSPDQGPAVVPPMIVHVVAQPVAETGDFNPDAATDV